VTAAGNNSSLSVLGLGGALGGAVVHGSVVLSGAILLCCVLGGPCSFGLSCSFRSVGFGVAFGGATGLGAAMVGCG